MLQGGPCPWNPPCYMPLGHITRSQLRQGAGGVRSPGHPPTTPPPHKARSPGCTVPGHVTQARAQALMPCGSHPCPTSPSCGELVSPSTAILSPTSLLSHLRGGHSPWDSLCLCQDQQGHHLTPHPVQLPPK